VNDAVMAGPEAGIARLVGLKPPLAVLPSDTV
jgi:hypothetical protein